MAMAALSCGSGDKQDDHSRQSEEAKQSGNPSLVTLSDAQIKSTGIVTGKAEKRKLSSLLKVNGKVDVPPQNI